MATKHPCGRGEGTEKEEEHILKKLLTFKECNCRTISVNEGGMEEFIAQNYLWGLELKKRLCGKPVIWRTFRHEWNRNRRRKKSLNEYHHLPFNTLQNRKGSFCPPKEPQPKSEKEIPRQFTLDFLFIMPWLFTADFAIKSNLKRILSVGIFIRWERGFKISM